MGRKAVSEEKRLLILRLSGDQSKTMSQIALDANASIKCVWTTLKNFKETGSVKDKPRSGRPQSTTDREKSFIGRTFIKESSLSLRKGTAEINERRTKKISYSTIRRVLKKKEVIASLAVKKQFLSITDKKKRLKWCKERKNWSIEKWAKVLFTDEANFEVTNRKGRFWFWRKKSPSTKYKFVLSKTQGGGGSVGIWGCINKQGTGMSSLYDGRLNSLRYIDILDDNLQASRDLFSLGDELIYQQDNAPCHTAGIVTDYFVQNQVEIMPWPARSPDLNPIENLWVWIDRKLQTKVITNKDQLNEAIREAWLEIPAELCKALVESMPRRMAACIKANGGHTKY